MQCCSTSCTVFPSSGETGHCSPVSPLCISLLLRLLQNGHLLDLRRGLLVWLFLSGERELLLPFSISVSHTYYLVFLLSRLLALTLFVTFFLVSCLKKNK